MISTPRQPTTRRLLLSGGTARSLSTAAPAADPSPADCSTPGETGAATYIEFVVQGVPVAKGRPRFAVRGGFARAYTPKATVDHEQRIANAARSMFTAPLGGSLRVDVITFHPIPKSLKKADKEAALLGSLRPAKKPDADNLLKALDALNGIAWHDDAQIVDLSISKFYGINPRTVVRVRAV